MADKRLEIVIFGATGFTGKHTVKMLAQFVKENPNFKFGVAGRRKEALEAVIKEFAPDIENIPVIVADLKDEESLKKMTQQAKVLVNCCGPYRLYGEAVVKACIATRTHQVDVNGEPQYMEQIQLQYNKAAKEAGVYIISACGFDSVPCDLGIIFTQQKFDGEINSIESYLNVWFTTNVGGPVIHYGTYESAVYGAAHQRELRPLRTKLFPEKLPTPWPRLKSRGFVHRTSVSEGWSTPFPGSDRSVALRTQRYLYEKYNQRPVQIQTYMTLKSFFSIITTAVLGLFFMTMSKWRVTRNILLKHPKIFSAGYASHEGPKKEVMENHHFSITFKAEGWTEKLADPTDKHKELPKKQMITKVTGVNPAYGATCLTLLLSAMMIIEESDKIPDEGGVLTPGVAFGNTSMIEKLNKHGLKFEVVSSITN